MFLISVSGCSAGLNKLFVCGASAGVSVGSRAAMARLVCATVITNLVKSVAKTNSGGGGKLGLMEGKRRGWGGEPGDGPLTASFQLQFCLGNSFQSHRFSLGD